MSEYKILNELCNELLCIFTRYKKSRTGFNNNYSSWERKATIALLFTLPVVGMPLLLRDGFWRDDELTSERLNLTNDVIQKIQSVRDMVVQCNEEDRHDAFVNALKRIISDAKNQCVVSNVSHNVVHRTFRENRATGHGVIAAELKTTCRQSLLVKLIEKAEDSISRVERVMHGTGSWFSIFKPTHNLIGGKVVDGSECELRTPARASVNPFV